MKPLMHPKTAEQVKHFLGSPVHALLVLGDEGAGKTTLVEYLTAQLLQTDQDIASHPYVLVVSPIEGSISVSSVREIRSFLQLKVPKPGIITRAVLVINADTMTTEAQNALLKSLEEPPSDTVFLLTANSEQGLLQTIQSRVRKLSLPPVDPAALTVHFLDKGHSKDDVAKALLLSNALPGLMTEILQQATDHPLTNAIAGAKSFLSATKFERLASIESLGKQKDAATQLLAGLEKIAQAGLHNPSTLSDKNKVKRWHAIVKHVLEAKKQLDQNASPKLVLSNLALHI